MWKIAKGLASSTNTHSHEAPHLSKDETNCPSMEGMLKKKNSQGVWKDRYCMFDNATFLTYKPKNNKPSNELKENIDLKDLDSIDIKDDTLHIELRNGDVLLYKGTKLDDWLYAIRTRAIWALKHEASSGSLEGMLKKKNSQGIWKDRYCQLDKSKFMTFKPKNNRPTQEIKENIELSDLRTIEIIDDTLQIELTNGETLLYKGTRLEDWQKELSDRSQEIIQANQEKVRAARSQSIDETSDSIHHLADSFHPNDQLEGILKKKNSQGIWKDRYCLFKQTTFYTYKPKSATKPSSELKESIDLKELEALEVEDDIIHLELKNGDKLLYRCENTHMLDQWARELQGRAIQAISYYKHSLQDQSQENNQMIHISGMLLKKSHNKFQGFQERYVQLQGCILKYYKKKSDQMPSGTINLMTVNFVRPFNEFSENTNFEIEDDQDRVFFFQASTNKEMWHWINVLEDVRKALLHKKEEERMAKIIADTPPRIRIMDEQGIAEFEKFILEEITNIYPDLEAEYDDTTLSIHLQCANELLQYIDVVQKEIQRCETRPARYDIFACVLTLVNQLIEKRFRGILAIQKTPPEEIVDQEHNENNEEEQDVDDDEDNLYKHKKNADDSEEDEGEEDPEEEENTRDRSSSARDRSSSRPKSHSQASSTTATPFKPIRHPLLERASLGELLNIVIWMTKYQTQLKKLRCPVYDATSKHLNTIVSKRMILSTQYLTPKVCHIFDLMHDVCNLYVYGGSSGSKGGAAAHLVEHCEKVWDHFLSNPAEAIQQQNNGSFYTTGPIDIWEAINQHISLAMQSHSPILHVMMAEKVVSSLLEVFNEITKFVMRVDPLDDIEIKDVALEFFCALANDTAVHIEEVVNLIESFDIPEIRDRIDEIFDPLTTALLNCGQECLKKLTFLVMTDVKDLLKEVFMPEWIEGNQMHTATATISDYMKDFEVFLVPFWSKKFVHMILEDVILQYLRVILFRNDTKTVTTTVTSNEPEQKQGFFSSIFKKTKEITRTITTTVPSHVVVDGESLGRLAQDVNILYGFFNKKAGEDVAADLLAIINEISLYMALDLAGLLQQVCVQLVNYPSAALAVREVVISIMKMRYSEFNKSDIDFLLQRIQPVIESCQLEAQKHEQEKVVEGKLGLLYLELVPKDRYNSSNKTSTLTDRFKMMANITMFARKKQEVVIEEEIDEDREDLFEGEKDEEMEEETVDNTPKNLVDEVMDVLQAQEDEDNAYIEQREEEEHQLELLKNKVGVLKYDCNLEKKSPAHNQWQKRYFKLVTRETQDPEHPYAYRFMWYKKEGSSVIKALEMNNIASIALLYTNRPMVYLPYPKRQLALQSAVGRLPSDECIPVSLYPHEENKPTAATSLSITGGNETYFVFAIYQSDKKEHILRSAKIDRIMKWINILALACGMAYDKQKKQWNRAVYDNYEQNYYTKLEAESKKTEQERKEEINVVQAENMIQSLKSQVSIDHFDLPRESIVSQANDYGEDDGDDEEEEEEEEGEGEEEHDEDESSRSRSRTESLPSVRFSESNFRERLSSDPQILRKNSLSDSESDGDSSSGYDDEEDESEQYTPISPKSPISPKAALKVIQSESFDVSDASPVTPIAKKEIHHSVSFVQETESNEKPNIPVKEITPTPKTSIPMQVPVKEPVKETVKEPIAKETIVPSVPIKEIKPEPTTLPEKDHSKENTKLPTKESIPISTVKEPVKAPIVTPVSVKEEPVKEPIKEPISLPLPVQTKESVPVKAIVKEEPTPAPVKVIKKEEPAREPISLPLPVQMNESPPISTQKSSIVKEEPIKEPVKEHLPTPAPVKPILKEETVKTPAKEPISLPLPVQMNESIPAKKVVEEEQVKKRVKEHSPAVEEKVTIPKKEQAKEPISLPLPVQMTESPPANVPVKTVVKKEEPAREPISLPLPLPVQMNESPPIPVQKKIIVKEEPVKEPVPTPAPVNPTNKKEEPTREPISLPLPVQMNESPPIPVQKKSITKEEPLKEPVKESVPAPVKPVAKKEQAREPISLPLPVQMNESPPIPVQKKSITKEEKAKEPISLPLPVHLNESPSVTHDSTKHIPNSKPEKEELSNEDLSSNSDENISNSNPILTRKYSLRKAPSITANPILESKILEAVTNELASTSTPESASIETLPMKPSEETLPKPPTSPETPNSASNPHMRKVISRRANRSARTPPPPPPPTS